MCRYLLTMLLAVTALPNASTIPDARGYDFTTIDVPFPEAVGTTSAAINDLGQITGFYLTSGFVAHGYVLSDGNFSAFDFTADAFTVPNAINNQGQVVGFGGTVSFLSSGGQFSIINIPGSVFTMANAINNAGQVVGTAQIGREFVGFFLDGGGLSFIRVPGAQASDARGINDAGQIVGVADGGVFLFSNGLFSYLDFPVAVARPEGINNSGTIVGWYQAPDFTIHGFVRDQLGFSTIDFPGATTTAVGGINNRGEIVGGYTDAGGLRHGFVAKPRAPAFAGTPGTPDCQGKTVSELAHRFGGLESAAAALGFSSVQALTDAIRAFCKG